MALIQIAGTFETSITCYVTGLETWISYHSVEWLLNGWGVQNGYVYLGQSGITATPFFTYTGLQSGTLYTISAILTTNEGDTFEVGPELAQTQSPSIPRPSLFSWEYVKSKGVAFNLTVYEWNSLCSNINAVRQYKGYTPYNFTQATKGNPFYASMYNQAVYAISDLNAGNGTLYTTDYWGNKTYNTRSAGDAIYASYLNNLVSAINSVT